MLCSVIDCNERCKDKDQFVAHFKKDHEGKCLVRSDERKIFACRHKDCSNSTHIFTVQGFGRHVYGFHYPDWKCWSKYTFNIKSYNSFQLAILILSIEKA